MASIDYTKSALPLVNHSNIAGYIGQYVIVHGKYNGVKNGSLTLQVQTEPSADILVNNFTRSFPINTNLKVVGKVASDQSIEFLDVIQLQDDFDLSLVNEMIPILNHKEVAGMFF